MTRKTMLTRPSRVDDGKNIFKNGLLSIQNKVDQRFYTTTLAFAHALCEVIHAGINTDLEDGIELQPKLESVVAPLTKVDYTDIRERRKLGKRILKSGQPMLEMALQREAGITKKVFDDLKHELERMIEASFEVQRNASTAEETEQSRDVIMVDASEITVADPNHEEDADHEIDEQADTVMAENPDVHVTEGANIEVNTSPVGKSTAEALQAESAQEKHGVKQEDAANSNVPDTPPDTNGYLTAPISTQPGPPTPPQSNGSLGQEHTNILTDGGVPWYLQSFDPVGTSVVIDPASEGAESHVPVEDRPDMDIDESKALEVDATDANIVTSPISTANAEASVTESAKKPARAKKRKPTTYRGRR